MDVLVDDARVWSFAPERDAIDVDGARLVPWPKALRRYLDGIARVTVREHLTGRIAVTDVCQFGVGSDPIRVVDGSGNPLALNKAGYLERTFDSVSSNAAGSLLDQMSKVLGILHDECGLPAFVSFGALLGVVREGELLHHDSDLDISYVSSHSHPAEVVRESIRIERTLHRHGFRHRRFSMADFKVLVKDATGDTRGIDIFGGFFLDGMYYLLPAVRAPLPKSAILPLGEVELEGRRFPAPADPAALLEAIYGREWRIPDPSFKFRPPPSTSRRFNGWMRGLRSHFRHWNDFYRSSDCAAVPTEPSAFARWIVDRIPESEPVVDMGSGNGRDALYFAKSGHRVVGLDYAPAAIAKSRAVAQADGLAAKFEVLDLCDLRQALVMGARLAADGDARTLYGRFLLDALDDEGRRNVWRLAEMALRAGGALYLEFRTDKDADVPHVFGEHYRRFLDPDMVVDEIESRGGSIEYREEGYGMAPFHDEDPHVCRLVARWSR